jgi:hypothetical protein
VFDRTGHILRRTVRERLIVTLKTGEAFDGVLLCADERTWELVTAKALGVGERGADVPVDGSLLIPAGNVAYSQRL